jgi:hypothetical protein
MTHHQVFGIISTIFLVYSFIPYCLGILNRTIKPHVFTWLIFSILSGIAFVAQYTNQAGPGMWFAALNSAMSFLFALSALHYGTTTITRGDWVALLFSLAAIPIWVVTHNPLLSVILICVIDTAAFWPTVRKSWRRPHEESIQTFLMCGISSLFAVAALDNMTVVTAMYPLWLALLNLPFVVMLFMRRQIIND